VIARLQNVANKDLATDAIKESLLNAYQLGQAQLEGFVKQCILTGDNNENVPVGNKFCDGINKNNAPTFGTLYEVVKQRKSDKEIILKADRSVLHRLVTAYEAGREVNMEEIMKHELMPVPVAITEINGTLRSGNKSLLADILTTGVACRETVTLVGRSSLLIDGQALVIAIGKPTGTHTFGELADTFVNTVLQKGRQYFRIDVLFDRYRSTSIKAATRQK
jgi:hypothetical protein